MCIIYIDGLYNFLYYDYYSMLKILYNYYYMELKPIDDMVISILITVLNLRRNRSNDIYIENEFI